MLSSSLRDFFSMSASGVLRGKVEDLAGLERTLLLATQRRRAAEALWSAGHTAEGLRLLRSALESTLAAARLAAQNTSDDDSLRAVLSAVGLENANALVVEADALLGAPCPDLDRELDDSHAAAFADGLKLQLRIGAAIELGLLDDTGRRLSKLRRIGGTAIVAVASVALVWWAKTVLLRDSVSASAHFADLPDYAPVMAIDGDPQTEWLLPDQSQGSIEVRPRRTHDLLGVRLLNAHNPPHNDRATKLVRVVATDAHGRETVGSFKFPEFRDAPSSQFVPLAAEDVVRVRVEVLEWFRKGGGLAEIELVSN